MNQFRFLQKLPLLLLAYLLFAVGLTQTSEAQESTLLIANVNSDGTLINSANRVNGNVTSSRFEEGVYEVEIESSGAFAGLSTDHIIPHVTLQGAPFNDEIATAYVTAVSSDEIQVIIRTSDAEDASVASSPEQSDSSFYLVLSRTSPNGIVSDASRYLLGAGFVDFTGNVVRSIGIDGIAVSSSREMLGDFTVTLSKPGAFGGDQASSYVLLLQSVSPFNGQDEGIRGTVDSVASTSSVTFRVGIDDLQDDTDNDFAFPADRNFFFTIFRIPSTPESPLPDSKLLLLAAKVDDSGTLLSGSSSVPGAQITSTRVSEGIFEVGISGAGLFAGTPPLTIMVHSQVNHPLISDEVSISYFTIADQNSGVATILINDVETAGQTVGVPEDRAFSVLVYRAEAIGRSDLRIGRKDSLSSMSGDGIYDPSGAGQRITAKGKGRRSIRSFFATDNDGNVIDNLLIQGSGGKKHLKVRHFQTTGGRQNITAATKSSGHFLSGLRPDETYTFATKTKFKGRSDKTRSRFLIRSISLVAPATVDAARVKVKRK